MSDETNKVLEMSWLSIYKNKKVLHTLFSYFLLQMMITDTSSIPTHVLRGAWSFLEASSLLNGCWEEK